MPNHNWDYKHITYIIDKLDDALERCLKGELVRMMFFLPPRHGKSSTITERFPSYVLTKFAWMKIIIGAYNETFAYRFSRKNRQLALQAGVKLKEDSQSMSMWETEKDGSVRCAGIRSGVTGLGANIIIIDDPVKNRQEANSQVISNRIYEEFRDSFMTRLEKYNMVILILTRWSELDLAGRILADTNADDWEIISFPHKCELPSDELGRVEGQTLCPELVPDDLVANLEKTSPSTYASLYQQRPSAKEGDLFKREWFKYYRALPAGHCQIIQSIDSAFKKGAENDFSVIGTWFKYATGFYLVDVFRGKLSYPELKAKAFALYTKYNASLILIEDKASGQSLIQDLRATTTMPIRAIQVSTDKVSRAHSATPQFEAGNIYLPEDATWAHDYIEELCMFPNGAHDDQVDMTTQFINANTKPSRELIIA